MDAIGAWPFLVSRNRTLDYRVIMAPDFLVESDPRYLLRCVTGQETNKPVFREVAIPNLGNLSLAYRVVRAENNKVTLEDAFSRPILWIEGLIFRQRNIKDYEVINAALDQARLQTQKAFREFWKARSDFTTVASSEIQIFLEPKLTTGRFRQVLGFLLRMARIGRQGCHSEERSDEESRTW